MSYENIFPEKGMYASEKGFTKCLEELDPTENYKGTPLQGLDAFERQLKRFDIKLSGDTGDRVEKFFMNSSSAALFPEYVMRAVRLGMEEQTALKTITAVSTSAPTSDYRALTTVMGEDEKPFFDVSEGAFIPETKIKTQENIIRLRKKGRMLVSSYEAIRYSKIDVFTAALKQIGASIAKAELDEAVRVLIEGDGNNNSAESVNIAGTEVSYEDLINMLLKLAPYKMNVIIASPGAARSIMMLPEFRSSGFKNAFALTGSPVTPIGANMIISEELSGQSVLALDRDCALEHITACPLTTEYDKLIDRQLERAAITYVSGFAKLFPDAVKILS